MYITQYTSWLFGYLLLLGQFRKLSSHKLTKLLKTFHKLLILTVLFHGLLGFLLEHIDGHHIFRIRKQLADFLIGGDCIQEVVGHPLAFGIVEIIINFHGVLHLFNF